MVINLNIAYPNATTVSIAMEQHNNICVGVCGINLHRPIIREYDLKLSESAEALILKSPRSDVSLLNS